MAALTAAARAEASVGLREAVEGVAARMEAKEMAVEEGA